MNNVLEFYVKMKDMMSGGLANLAKTSKQTFGKMQGDIKQTQSTADKYRQTLGSLYDRMNDLKRFRMDEALGKKQIMEASNEIRKLRSEIDKLEGRGRGSASSGGGMRGLIGPLMPYVGAAGAISLGKSFVNAAMDFGMQQKSYEVLAQSPQKGKDLAAHLQQLKQNTIMGAAVYPNAQMLLAFGDSVDRVIPHLRMLGDISMGDADKLHRLSYAFGEVGSSGRLTGRQLLQFLNAGFNPLLEISKKTGESMEELRKKMRAGEITFKMVENAFVSATSKGGKFYDMMNQIADTPFGKMKMLEGKWAAFKIDMGTLLMPLAEGFMDVTNSVLRFLDVHTTVPQKLMQEQGELNALISMVTKYNEGNVFRNQLISDLVKKYPEYFSGIDAEKVKNSELLSVLEKVNEQYEKRIGLATSDELINMYKNEGDAALKETKRWMAMHELAMRPDEASHNAALNMRTLWERMSFVGLDEMKAFNPETTWGFGTMGNVNYLRDKEAQEKSRKHVKELEYMASEAIAITQDGKRFKELLPKAKDRLAFLHEVNGMRPDYYNHMDPNNTIDPLNPFKGFKTPTDAMNSLKDPFVNRDFSKLSKLMKWSASEITGTKKGDWDKSTNDDGGKDVAKGITSGGVRNITINGVTIKVAEKIEIHSSDANGVVQELEPKIQDVIIRLLTSGADVQ